MKKSLYQNASLYSSVFGIRDEEEIEFYKKLLPNESRVLSLGCGDGSLELILCESNNLQITGIDASEEMIAEAKRKLPNHEFHALRFEGFQALDDQNKFLAVISPLLSLNYVCRVSNWENLFRKLSKAAHKDAIFLFDVLISHQPNKFQGIIERGENHELRFYDILDHEPFFSTIMTELEVKNDEQSSSRKAPLALLQPDKFSAFVKQFGFKIESFYSCHDLNSKASVPPVDARRAMIKIMKSKSS